VQDLHDERTKNNTAKGCGAQSVKVRASLLKMRTGLNCGRFMQAPEVQTGLKKNCKLACKKAAGKLN
jgi:hypothetical protein